jgi:hypothetical protein
VAAQVVASRVVLSSTELVSYGYKTIDITEIGAPFTSWEIKKQNKSPLFRSQGELRTSLKIMCPVNPR